MTHDAQDNWLRASAFTCRHCGTRLFRADHSPMLDDYRLYCDRCPTAIEISFYDDVLSEVWKTLPLKHTREQLMAAIEPRLRLCGCGGRFRDGVPRRCFCCGNAVITEEPAGVDLYVYIGCEDQGREPTEKERAAFDEFLRRFVRTEDPWQ